MKQMDKHYDPGRIESKWYRYWTDRKLFHSDSQRKGEPYCVVIPPPNVTGILHMGHALNNTIQDILVRWRRMQGRNVVWMPGTDHAGIATQNVVERALRKQNLGREDIGRKEFVDRVWQWRGEYGGTIINQLKRLGASCDWERERFTMDEGLSSAVVEVFCRLYDEGLIYRGNYIVNWCPRCHTALSDEESEHRDTDGKLFFIRYPAENGGHLTVATTRPETLLGDVAVAVNPVDSRFDSMRGGTVRLPVLGRELPVIEDAYVDPGFGTGAVKITPAHDPNDFQVAQRHRLEPINVMNGDGTMNAAAGPYAGMDRFECRRRLVADLQSEGLLEKEEGHKHAVGHCYRCDTVVEPRLSPQWFVKMRPLAEPAIEALQRGRVRFVPERWDKVYLDWLENIRDWCISRQIWWGHRIPVYTCGECGQEWAARSHPSRCSGCGAVSERITQDEDVLDTWFSSWLWPFSTFGWPEDTPDLKFYYPTNDLVTASEIIFFWVARMVMAGFAFMGREPFRKVYIHGTVRDEKGRKMSKSLGNSIDPLSVIEKYSADALRASLMMITSTGQDVFLSDEKFEMGRNFGTKLWNAARLMRRHMDTSENMDWRALALNKPVFDPAALRDDDRYILGKLDQVIRDGTAHLENFRFQDMILCLHDFVWHKYCDWYLEIAKSDLYGDDETRRVVTLQVMTFVFSQALRMLHPVMPFVTEELWHALEYGSEEESIMLAPWPEPVTPGLLDEWGIDGDVVEFVADKYDLVRAGRQLRTDYDIPPARDVCFFIRCPSEEDACRIVAAAEGLKGLLKAEKIEISHGAADGESKMPGLVTRRGSIHLRLAGLVDADAETRRLSDQRDKIMANLRKIDGKLSNENFLAKAPEKVIEQQRVRRGDLMEQGTRLDNMIKMLVAAQQS